MPEQRIKISLITIDKGDDTIQFQIELTNAVNSTSMDVTIGARNTVA